MAFFPRNFRKSEPISIWGFLPQKKKKKKKKNVSLKE